MNTNDLLSIIKDCAFEVRKELAPGYLESYIKKLWRSNYDPMGLILKKSHLFGLITKDIIHVGDFRADIIVEGKVIIELKAIS